MEYGVLLCNIAVIKNPTTFFSFSPHRKNQVLPSAPAIGILSWESSYRFTGKGLNWAVYNIIRAEELEQKRLNSLIKL